MNPPSSEAEAEAGPTPPPSSGLLFDWHHRPRTWATLSFWLLLVFLVHVAAFLVFRVRMPSPARAMPVPATIALAPADIVDPSDPVGHTALAALLSPDESADLDLPEHEPADPHVPAFADHVIARQPWPPRPEPAAWPEVSQVSQPVLPAPTRPSESPADPPQ